MTVLVGVLDKPLPDEGSGGFPNRVRCAREELCPIQA